ncbi:hypothetical protein K493DRAFT_317751 [Basidiobolus meristosporus CBS 931.73]|uniref:Uncharacterized protein n=1 Tax=Basidiobolus meristosporus CBS 931.73 TaxID=1314790 RepID=A0A1Y1XYB2_9FUNG|nr:hypothetical protein K493DRAFT_317751 [Basidiobolus meristosporus CBS 931.73]|eukprot:ORX90729.1 hypothetical protein K493DRAFT_317751 [Basidiobolus meristosporus CBS 931.73]
MWVYPGMNKKITGFYTSLEVPTGYDPPTTYWCVAAWYLGYFGVQVLPDGSHALIMAEWNDKQKSPRIDLAIPHGRIEQCEEKCPEGAMAHVLIPGHAWQTGVKYDFKVEVDFNGTNEIFHSYFFTEDHWELIAQITAPNYGRNGMGYLYQFLENWLSNYDQERIGIYSNQHFRYEGDSGWYPAASISPNKNANKAHPEYYTDAVPLKEGNGMMLKLDGTQPGSKNGWFYYPTFHINTTNMSPPPNNPPPLHGKHTVTVVETYVGYKRFTDSAVTTTTTKKQWHTVQIEPTITLKETLLDTTLQTETIHRTRTQLTTFTPTTDTRNEFATVTEILTDTTVLGQPTTSTSTVTNERVETQNLTIFETVQPTVTAPRVLVTTVL